MERLSASRSRSRVVKGKSFMLRSGPVSEESDGNLEVQEMWDVQRPNRGSRSPRAALSVGEKCFFGMRKLDDKVTWRSQIVRVLRSMSQRSYVRSR